MYILGISCYYHDSSATLIKDGQIVAAVEEERFTRIKHDSEFPINAIKCCLGSQGITINDIEYIGFYEKPLLKFERVLYQHIYSFPKSMKIFMKSMPSWFNQKLKIIKIIKKQLKYRKEILFIQHHLAHASSAFYPSSFEKSAILIVDGVGEWSTTTLGYGENCDITLLKEIKFPHSLGLLYSTITAYLGFKVNNSEYKVMGLSAYGDPNVYYHKLKKVIDVKSDGSFKLHMEYFDYIHKERMPSKKMCDLLGGPIRTKEHITQRHKDIAASLQLLYEEVLFKIVNNVYHVTKCDNLVIAGGCGLNSVANGKILRNTPFKNIWIQPNSSDGGTSMGVVFYIYHHFLQNKRKFQLTNSSFGPEFKQSEIKEYLDKNQIQYTMFDNEESLIKKTAELLYENNVVGWFQGRMEWGPRALGNRSILANPCNPKAQELLNLKVKHREMFRPFAPVVCADDAERYFECDIPLQEPTDYMLMVYPIRKEWRSKIPSVTHVDGSGRLQTIKQKQNPLYYNLIKEFGRLSGIPVLINTSFNIRGEPIVCTPQNAFMCVMGTEIDYLVMGTFLIKRSDNPEHMWNSEKQVKKTYSYVWGFVFSFLVFITSFLVAEFLLRLFLPDTNYLIRDNTFMYKIKPDKNIHIKHIEYGDFSVKTNNLGYVDENHDIYSDKKKVIIIGDSFVAGTTIPYDEHFIRLLQNRFEDDVEFMAMGVDSYSTENQLVILKEHALQFKPDVIILMFVWNDIYDNNRRSLYIPDEGLVYPVKRSGLMRIKDIATSKSIIFFYIDKTIQQLFVSADQGENILFYGTPRDLFLNTTNGYFDETFEQLLLFENVAKENTIKTYYVLIPLKEQVNGALQKKYNLSKDNYYENKYQDTMTLFFEKNTMKHIKILDIFKQMNTNNSFYYEIDGHWNKQGNALIAEILYQNIKGDLE